MRRTHPPPPPPARAPIATLPAQLQPLWALAVAIAESAAEIAATRPIPSWRAGAYLYAAADQAGWRADPSGPGGEFRFAVLLAEAATARFIAGDGYLSNRQLATDLRHGAAWLATGALLPPPKSLTHPSAGAFS